jgi:hypothetical protein
VKKKNLIRGQTKVFNWRIKSNWKITLTKWKTNQKNESRIGKKQQQKLWLIDEIESQRNFNWERGHDGASTKTTRC